MELPVGWILDADRRALRRVYELEGFSEAAALVGRIAAEADRADHHPDLHLTRRRRLEVVLTTHDAGGAVTAKDYHLAAVIEALPRRERAGPLQGSRG